MTQSIQSTTTTVPPAPCECLDFTDPGYSDSSSAKTLGESVIWITWEKQLRTTELSKALGVKLFRFNHSGSRLTRYFALTKLTWKLLQEEKPQAVIVQNPSMILAAAVAFMKRFHKFKLIVDRHTNFMINLPMTPKIRLLTIISDYSLQNSDLTIVTNKPLAEIVEKKGSPSFVLPDKIPTPLNVEPAILGPGHHVVFICTYASDEPYNEVIGMAPHLPDGITIHITGRISKALLTPASKQILKDHSSVVLTDFLTEEDYWGMLDAVDAIIDLTTLEHCLVCGAYEGISLNTPLILSDKKVNKDLFGEAPVLVDAETKSILKGVLTVLDELESRKSSTTTLHNSFVKRWESDFSQLTKIISDLAWSTQGD